MREVRPANAAAPSTYTGAMLRTVRRSAVAIAGTLALAMSVTVAGPVGTGSAAVSTPLTVASVQPAPGEIVGIAAPVTVRFAAPVADRAAAQRAITFDSPATPDGEFGWLNDSTVEWTPSGYWPAHSTISVRVDGAAPLSFQTGAAVVGVADIDAHTFTVSIDDEVVREMPASMGKPKFPTPIGNFRVLGKESVVVMDSRTIGIPLDDPEGYKLTVYDAVRVTWGGVYVHGAPWSTGSQGYANVSHGCINLSPDNADWYFNTVRMGDPVIVQA